MSNKTKVQKYDSYDGMLDEINLGNAHVRSETQTFKYVGIQLTVHKICTLTPK